MTINIKNVVTFLCFSGLLSQGHAFTNNYVEEVEIEDKASLVEALQDGEFDVNLRLRYEDVKAEFPSFDRGAQATTLRTNIRYETARYNLFSAAVGVQDVRALPDDENYFSGSNNELDDALVADPEITRINEGWLAYDIINTYIKYGRQPLDWDNSRFVGSEDWRQLGQTFSGLSIRNEYLNYIRLRYAQLHRMETYLGEDHDSGEQSIDAKLANIEYRGILNSFLTLYHYDIDNQSDDDRWDSVTTGLRFSGVIENEPRIEYAFEYAKQRDGHDNPANYLASYQRYELGLTLSGVRLFAGQEVLGADGNAFFVTPLSNKHEFQGLSDQFENGFLGNITGGLKDQFVSLGYILSEDAYVKVTHHDFDADEAQMGQDSLGSEWNLESALNWQQYQFMIKFSDYDARAYGQDTRKVWLSAQMTF